MVYLINRIKNILDLLNWYYRTSNVRSSKTPIHKKTLIISEVTTSIATVKVNCIYAKCLQLIGYKILILFKHKQPLYECYYKCLKINDFIYFQEKKNPNKVKMIKCITQNLERENFLKIKVDGIQIGKWISSRIVREEKKGEFKIENCDKIKLYKYINDSVNSINTIKDVIKNYKIDAIIFNERGYSPSGEIFECCLKNKINTIQWFGSPLDNHHCFKRYIEKNKSCHPLTLSKSSFENLLNHKSSDQFAKKILKHLKSQYHEGKWFNRQNLQENKKIFAKHEIIKKLKLDPTKKIAVIFSHVMYDATYFYGTSLYRNYKLWLKETLLIASTNKNVNWVLKIHPVNKFKNDIEGTTEISLEEKLLEEIFKKVPENIFIIKACSEISTYSLFHSIDYGLTVRGTIGCELSCFGIPVFTAGTGRYSNNGFTIDSDSKKNYVDNLNNIEKFSRLSKKQVNLARIYTYGSLIAKSIPMDGIKIKYNITNSLKPYHTDVFFENLDVKELINKSDIRLFVDWFDNENLVFSDEDLIRN